jgi:hypothetical protein
MSGAHETSVMHEPLVKPSVSLQEFPHNIDCSVLRDGPCKAATTWCSTKSRQNRRRTMAQCRDLSENTR